MQAMYAKRLLKLADFLQQLPPQKFDFRSFTMRGDKPMLEALKARRSSCGTTACAVGWMPAVFPRAVCWIGVDRPGYTLNVAMRNGARRRDAFWGTCKRVTNFDVAQRFFRLTYDETQTLFNPEENEDSLSADATAKQVATHIKRFVRAKQRVVRT